MSATVGKPTLDEAVAVWAAADAFGKKLRPRVRRTAKDLPRLLAELADAIQRVQNVTVEEKP